ncbi:hypothetical protein B0O80DRAFT_504691 [Mortierella sp. GBAus27b]|nr:hypothetical protein B0O80DRAFT_504691 [Mortierella sp. GBAus27b]
MATIRPTACNWDTKPKVGNRIVNMTSIIELLYLAGYGSITTHVHQIWIRQKYSIQDPRISARLKSVLDIITATIGPSNFCHQRSAPYALGAVYVNSQVGIGELGQVPRPEEIIAVDKVSLQVSGSLGNVGLQTVNAKGLVLLHQATMPVSIRPIRHTSRR